jgi:hypothetical protein
MKIKSVATRTRRQLFGTRLGAVTDSWDSAVAEFQSKRDELATAEAALWQLNFDNKVTDADLQDWKNALAKVQAASATMDATANALTSVSDGWESAKGWFGLNGVRGMAQTLGVLLPAIPLTLGGLSIMIVAASAALTAAYAVIRNVNTRNSVYSIAYNDALLQTGDAAQAAAIAAKAAADAAAAEPSVFSEIKGSLGYVALIGGIGLLIFMNAKK